MEASNTGSASVTKAVTLRPRPVKLAAAKAPKKKGVKKKAKAKPELYIPEGILTSREGKKGLEYLVKWLGYPSSQNTWEPKAVLQETLSARDIKELINAAAK